AACRASWIGAICCVDSDVLFVATRAGVIFDYSYAIVGAVRRMTGVRPSFTGKPSLHALRHVAAALGVRCAEVGVVGYDPLVEMIMARRGGATGFGVCTGTTSRAQWRRQPVARRPHHVLENVGDLFRWLGRPARRR